MLYLKRLCTTQSVNNAINLSFFLSLSLSTHVSALNGHLQVSYYAKTALILSIYHIRDCTLHDSDNFLHALLHALPVSSLTSDYIWRRAQIMQRFIM
jgi:hypothetical protein